MKRIDTDWEDDEKTYTEFDYTSLIIDKEQVDSYIELYSLNIERDDNSKSLIKFRNNLLNKFLFTNKLKEHEYIIPVDRVVYQFKQNSDIISNNNIQYRQIVFYYIFYNNNHTSQSSLNNLSQLLDMNKSAICKKAKFYKYLDSYLIQMIFKDKFNIAENFIKYIYNFEEIIRYNYDKRFNTIFEALKFLNLDADLTMPIKDYAVNIGKMNDKQFYQVALQQLSRRYDKEWFFSCMRNSFEKLEEARTAFAIMMNFKYDGNSKK